MCQRCKDSKPVKLTAVKPFTIVPVGPVASALGLHQYDGTLKVLQVVAGCEAAPNDVTIKLGCVLTKSTESLGIYVELAPVDAAKLADDLTAAIKFLCSRLN